MSKNVNNYKGYTKTGYISFQTQKCLEAIESGKLCLARKILKEFSDDFSEDDTVKLIKIKLAFIEKDYELCKELFNSIQRHDRYILNETTFYIFLEDYDKLFQLYYDYYHEKRVEFKDDDEYLSHMYERIKLYLQRTFSVTDSVPLKFNGLYSVKQIINYDRDAAIDHIIRHHGPGAKEYKCIFSEDVDIPELYDKVVKLIEMNKEKKVLEKLKQHYIIYWPNIGHFVGRPQAMCMYLVVGVNYNSSEIITMYPTEQYDYKSKIIDYRDLEDLNIINDSKIKILSRIDKFNNKYKKD